MDIVVGKKVRRTRALAAGKRVKFNTQLPFCKVIMQCSCIHDYMVLLPSEFSKKINVESGKITLQEGEQTWETRFSKRNSRIKICGGWMNFVRENDLNIGDVCAFELLPSTDFVTLKVTVLRTSAGVSGNMEVTGTRRITRKQARINNTSTPEACPHLPEGSLASPWCSRKNARAYPRAAKRARGRRVTEEQEIVLIASDDSDNESIDDDDELCREDNLPKKLVVRSDDPSLQAYSNNDSQSLSESLSNLEAELITYARRRAKIRSNSKAGITGNAHKDCVAFVGENISAQNVPRISAGNGIGTMPSEEPSTASAAAVERVLEPACHLTRTGSFGLTEMINMHNLERGTDEVQSPAVGSVQGYIVKQKFVSILRLIINKYGDIVANYEMKSIKRRSSSLEVICEIIQILQEKDFNELSLDEITTCLAEVRDFKKISMKVEWLETRLEEMEAAKCAIKESSSLKEEHLKKAEHLKELKNKLKDERTELNERRTQSVTLANSINEQMKKLEFCKAKTQELEKKEKSTMEDLKIAKDDVWRLKQTTSDSVHKVQFLLSHPLVDGLL